ncbi:MAG TPA: hypothetical protein VFK33_04735 [Bacillales bacterium]|nr:hypothetical protein [Bacillales bacterium]
MQGLFFYWTAWAAWVIVTFFMEKGKARTEAAAVILMVIACSAWFVTIQQVAINVSLMVLLFFGYRKLGKLRRLQLLYHVCICHIVTFAYLGFCMYTLYDPAILWIGRKWMAAVLIFLLVQFLVRTFALRCITAIVGAVHGNLLFAWVLHGFSLPYQAGSVAFLDLLAACVGMIAVWQGYLEAAHLLNQLFKRTFPQRGHYTK